MDDAKRGEREKEKLRETRGSGHLFTRTSERGPIFGRTPSLIRFTSFFTASPVYNISLYIPIYPYIYSGPVSPFQAINSLLCRRDAESQIKVYNSRKRKTFQIYCSVAILTLISKNVYTISLYTILSAKNLIIHFIKPYSQQLTNDSHFPAIIPYQPLRD